MQEVVDETADLVLDHDGRFSGVRQVALFLNFLVCQLDVQLILVTLRASFRANLFVASYYHRI